MQKKVLVAMSGGVDSSATAAILCQKGYDCIGVTMKLYNLPDDAVRSNTCCTLSDAEDAKSVAYRLGMPYYVMNFTADFAKEVIDRFVSAYERGETPNPCIDCNRCISELPCWAAMRLQPDTMHGLRTMKNGADGC